MNEVEAYANLLAEERRRIVDVVANEHRPYEDGELERMVLVDKAIDAIVHTENRRQPPDVTPALPSPSQPGSDYRIVAERVHSSFGESYRFSMQMVGDYGKWMVATIAAAHLGGIFFIGGLDGVPLDAREPALWALLVGLVLVLTCSLVTYFNWSMNAAAYSRLANANMLVDPKAWPQLNPQQVARIGATVWWAVGLGSASVISLIAAAALLSIYA